MESWVLKLEKLTIAIFTLKNFSRAMFISAKKSSPSHL